MDARAGGGPPVVPALRTWGYAVFGGLYAVHSPAADLLLDQLQDDDEA